MTRISWYWWRLDWIPTIAEGNNLRYPRDYTSRPRSGIKTCPIPFNPITKIGYNLFDKIFVNITVYDMPGNVTKNLIYEDQPSGYNEISWNATNNQGKSVSAGIYLYRIEASNFRQTKKMILLLK